MSNADFWASVRSIVAEGFTPEGLLKLDGYAEQFISGRLVYQRFSPQEQHGCAAGGTTNVIASLLAGAEVGTDSQNQGKLSTIYSLIPQNCAKEELEHCQRMYALLVNPPKYFRNRSFDATYHLCCPHDSFGIAKHLDVDARDSLDKRSGIAERLMLME